MTQYVQHKSGQGEKYPVNNENDRVWISYFTEPYQAVILPKSEYLPCSPPERWVDVTQACEFNDHEACMKHINPDGKLLNVIVLGTACGLFEGYRLRKVQVGWIEGRTSHYQSAFVVERKAP